MSYETTEKSFNSSVEHLVDLIDWSDAGEVDKELMKADVAALHAYFKRLIPYKAPGGRPTNLNGLTTEDFDQLAGRSR